MVSTALDCNSVQFYFISSGIFVFTYVVVVELSQYVHRSFPTLPDFNKKAKHGSGPNANFFRSVIPADVRKVDQACRLGQIP